MYLHEEHAWISWTNQLPLTRLYSTLINCFLIEYLSIVAPVVKLLGYKRRCCAAQIPFEKFTAFRALRAQYFNTQKEGRKEGGTRVQYRVGGNCDKKISISLRRPVVQVSFIHKCTFVLAFNVALPFTFKRILNSELPFEGQNRRNVIDKVRYVKISTPPVQYRVHLLEGK